MTQQKSLKSTLLWLLIPILTSVMIIFLALSAQEVKTQVNQAFDRTLAGALRSIEVNIHTENGGLSMEQPFYLFEFLELTTQSPVYFRVSTEDGLTELGYPDIPLPKQKLNNKPIFYNTHYFGENIRVAAIAIPPKNTLNYSPNTMLIIQVAELSSARQSFITKIIKQTLIKDSLILLILVGVIWLGILLGVRPLKTLSHAISSRHENDLRPIITQHIPKEVQTLVDTLNTHMARYIKKSQRQKQFLDDASHQLRTPLSVLNIQVSYAKSLTTQNDELNEVLDAIQKKINSTIELTNQLLTLAKVQDITDNFSTHLTYEIFNLSNITQDIVNELFPIVQHKKLNYGLDIPYTPIFIKGIPWLIKEALSNLIHNAIKYSSSSGSITISIKEKSHFIELSVEDNGPGMSTEEIAQVGKRFLRKNLNKEQEGSGLGLAIVKTIADVHHATFKLVSHPKHQGLRASLLFSKN